MIAICFAFVFLNSSATAQTSHAIWAVSDGEKIERDELNSPHKRGNAVWDGKRVKLFGARNEVIAFQLIVEAGASGIRRLSAALPELSLKDGRQKIVYRAPGADPSQTVGRPIQLFAVNYLNVTQATGASWFYKSAAAKPSDPVGWKPVQLVPENASRGGFPLAVARRQNQAIWIEIYTARNLSSGAYRGQVAVQADGKRTVVPVELELFDFTLPDENSLPATFYGPGKEFDDRAGAWRMADEWMTFLKERLPEAVTFLYLPDEPSPRQFAYIRQLADNVHSNPGPGRALRTM